MFSDRVLIKKTDLVAICDEIRNNLEIFPGDIRYEDILSSLQLSFSDAYNRGGATRDTEFWSIYQKEGTETNYSNHFSGIGWTKETFNPKYDICPTKAYMMFRDSRIYGDLVEMCENLGITIDFSRCDNFQYAFIYATFSRIGVIDMQCVTSKSQILSTFDSMAGLKTIDKIILPTSEIELKFTGCSSLKNITFEGEIKGDINFQWSDLTYESVVNICEHLKSYYGTSEEFAHTIYLSSNTKEMINEDPDFVDTNITYKCWNLG